MGECCPMLSRRDAEVLQASVQAQNGLVQDSNKNMNFCLYMLTVPADEH